VSPPGSTVITALSMVIDGRDSFRQRTCNLDHVLIWIEMVDCHGADRAWCRLVEYERVVSFADRYCVAHSDVNSVVAVPNGDRIEASELVIEDIAIALPRTTVLL
jgi:hypothetical protein